MQFVETVLARRRIAIAITLSVILVTLLQWGPSTHTFSSKLGSSQSRESPRVGLVDSSTVAQRLRSDKPTLDIVVSHYNEDLKKTAIMLNELLDLPKFRRLDVEIHFYTKNKDWDLNLIRRTINTTHVTLLPNLGREGGTFIDHIILNFDRLARHSMFIQASMHEYDHAKDHIRDYFGVDTGVLSLGAYESCNCVDCTDPWDVTRRFPRLEELYAALNGQFCPNSVILTYLGQFIASATRIRGRGLKTYEYLKKVLEADESHFIHADPKQDAFQDDVTNPYFGHTLERSWMILFGCSEARLVEKCGSWSGLRIPRKSLAANDDCQCLDDIRVF
ncbi:triose-phosphate transporter family-domain-containing protein [Venturia nashicola]|uniref:Triose-phosphate transporter family-domain-containing protein n=1 Tax=Venturia nashicola TaxID=86259 RepID=A0A4Z1NLP7_9PEZI|nr:triose-phosphate transporter family-domain-containing protein [Venturia nashicola]TLD22609.1 triose-phosphate transporter family-domain-containing protein [Venturia nashicola]